MFYNHRPLGQTGSMLREESEEEYARKDLEAPQKKQSEIEREFGNLSDAREELEKSVEQLESNLNPILRRIPPLQESEEKLTTDLNTELGKEIRTFRMSIQEIANQIREINRRVEL